MAKTVINYALSDYQQDLQNEIKFCRFVKTVALVHLLVSHFLCRKVLFFDHHLPWFKRLVKAKHGCAGNCH